MNTNDYEVFKKVEYTSFINKGREFQLSTYPYLDIVLNDHCNAKCKFCIGHLVHKKELADVEVIKKKARYAIEEMGVREVLLLGGEPTVNDTLFEIVKFLKQFGLNKICTTTNAHRMIKEEGYAEKLLSSGLTHVNISLMSLDPESQALITGSKVYVGIESLKSFKELADSNGVKIRINNNVFYGNNDSVVDMWRFYLDVCNYCHSVKFSPLLKTDSFSTVNEVTEFNREHLLSDSEYDDLWHKVEAHVLDYPIVRNVLTFGFVEYSMILLPTPIILNYNQHGMLRKKVIEEHKINNVKLLATGDLSLSWNREEEDFFIEVP